MSKHSRIATLGAAVSLCAAAASAHILPRLAPGYVLVENTGSTNTAGYTIYAWPTGAVWFARAAGVMSTTTHFDFVSVPKTQAKKLFQDLALALPLTAIPVRQGMRSASFGTRTYITYKGQKSPDLTFASDPRTIALKADIDAITKSLHIGNAPRRPIVIHLNSANTPGTRN